MHAIDSDTARGETTRPPPLGASLDSASRRRGRSAAGSSATSPARSRAPMRGCTIMASTAASVRISPSSRAVTKVESGTSVAPLRQTPNAAASHAG